MTILPGMKTETKTLVEMLIPGESAPGEDWQLRMIRSDECLSYVAWNTATSEALVAVFQAT